jgi:hypothetical protein
VPKHDKEPKRTQLLLFQGQGVKKGSFFDSKSIIRTSGVGVRVNDGITDGVTDGSGVILSVGIGAAAMHP